VGLTTLLCTKKIVEKPSRNSARFCGGGQGLSWAMEPRKETNNKNKSIRELYRGINEFKKGYQPTINIVKDKNGNLLADPQSVLNRWKNFFNQVLNICGIYDVRHMDIHMPEPLVPEPSLVKVETAIGKLRSYKSPGTDQIPGELIKAGVKHYVQRYTNLFVLYEIRRNKGDKTNNY
jgi:hypothetical protein